MQMLGDYACSKATVGDSRANGANTVNLCGFVILSHSQNAFGHLGLSNGSMSTAKERKANAIAGMCRPTLFTLTVVTIL